MYALLFSLVFGAVTTAQDVDRDIRRFKSQIDSPVAVMRWLSRGDNAESIDLLSVQRKELEAIQKKYIQRCVQAEKDALEQYPYRRHCSTPEELAQAKRFFEAYGKALKAIRDAWRAEMKEVLLPQQVVRINESMWRASGENLLFNEKFQRVLGLTAKQKAELKEIYRLSNSGHRVIRQMVRAGVPMANVDLNAIIEGKKTEALQKARELLTDEQQRRLRLLLGAGKSSIPADAAKK